MSVLTPLRARRRRAPTPMPTPAPTPPEGVAVVVPPEWHVGRSHPGMFPEHEVGCACAKAPCGLAIPRPDVLCAAHQGRVEYRQAHPANECSPRKWFQKRPGRSRSR